MISRRQFLAYGGTSLAFFSVANEAISTGLSKAAERSIPSSILFDQDFVGSRYFARQVAQYGMEPSAIQGDVATLWHQELHPRWRQGKRTVAGLTAEPSLFCVEQLASNHWMGLRFRAEHRYRKDGSVEHRLSGSKPFVRCAIDLLARHADWQVAMAELLTCRPSNKATRIFEGNFLTCANPDLADDKPLISWIITANHER